MKFNYFLWLVTVLAHFQAKGQQADSSAATYVRPLFDFDGTRPVFKLAGGQLENSSRMLRFYAFTGYREGVDPVKRAFNFNMDTRVDPEQGTISQRMFNLSIEEMVTFGMSKPWQVILEVRDPSRYRYLPAYGSKLEWMRRNGHCYEMTLPGEFASRCLQIVKDDIDRFFKISRTREKRTTRVLVLSPVDPQREAAEVPRPMQGKGVMDLEGLTDYLAGSGLPLLVPEIRRTDRLFDLGELAGQGRSVKIAELQQVLLAQGFRLTEQTREMDFLVIRETGDGR